MSYQIIPNITFILAVLGILLLIIRRLPQTDGDQTGQEASAAGQRLLDKGLPVVALSKIKSQSKFWIKKIWNFILEAKDLRPYSAAGYQMKKIFAGTLPGFGKPEPQKPLTTGDVRNEQYYLDNIKLQPKNLAHYDALGKFYIGTDNFTEAADIYLYLTNHKPTTADFHARLAYCYYQLKNYQKAAESYKKSIALDSTQPNRYYNLALCWEAAGATSRPRPP